MQNIPVVQLGIVAVSRDCFPIELSRRRRGNVVASCKELNVPVVEIETIIENERDVLRALDEMKRKSVNALAIYLGNFGPEGPTTLLAQRFSGPVMFVAAAEDSGNDLVNGRGDAYCGMLSASYNIGLRRLRPYIPEYPVGDPGDIASMLAEFLPVARTVLGVRNLKIISFGPRPFDFLTCHAPIQPLYDMGVEVMENSELDLFDLVQAEKGSSDAKRVAGEIAKELGPGNTYPDLNEKIGQYEAALEKYMQANLGASQFVAFANKCWPAFQKYFGHVPCYMNSRLAAKGIPVACEADIYGALSEYMSICATELPPAILDINNSVPKDMYDECRKAIGDYSLSDLWMGFHCGNTSSACLLNPSMQHQLIMHRLLEPEKKPDITRGTLEGRIQAGPVSIFRIQSTTESRIQAYIANGEVLDVNPKSFGSIGVFAIREMGRFYRHVLIEKRFPHHTAIAFRHAGKTLFAACRMLGVDNLFFNYPKGVFYPTENPF
ncbi:MAG: L-fucose isomerase-like protein [Acidobacteria bacterium]|nr:L-fucose isomerase-like protein [Acidobacteriota bacterium]